MRWIEHLLTPKFSTSKHFGYLHFAGLNMCEEVFFHRVPRWTMKNRRLSWRHPTRSTTKGGAQRNSSVTTCTSVRQYHLVAKHLNDDSTGSKVKHLKLHLPSGGFKSQTCCAMTWSSRTFFLFGSLSLAVQYGPIGILVKVRRLQVGCKGRTAFLEAPAPRQDLDSNRRHDATWLDMYIYIVVYLYTILICQAKCSRHTTSASLSLLGFPEIQGIARSSSPTESRGLAMILHHQSTKPAMMWAVPKCLMIDWWTQEENPCIGCTMKARASFDSVLGRVLVWDFQTSAFGCTVLLKIDLKM